MPSVADAKSMAKSLRSSLARRGIDISHGAALEIIAGQLGYKDWNILAAKSDAGEPARGVRFTATMPILRIFDEPKAREFYIQFLGFALDWEHRFEEGLPAYMQVSRSGLSLHLSGHHGDATPGSTIFVAAQGVGPLQRELMGRNYPHGRPKMEEHPWGSQLTVTDPFGNRIRFCERRGETEGGAGTALGEPPPEATDATGGQIEVRNPNKPDFVRRLDGRKYEAVKRALLEVAGGKADGLAFSQLVAGIRPLLSPDPFPRGRTCGWWTKMVQLDLEAKGLLKRIPGRPARWRVHLSAET